jgi:hypothetical protein
MGILSLRRLTSAAAPILRLGEGLDVIHFRLAIGRAVAAEDVVKPRIGFGGVLFVP